MEISYVREMRKNYLVAEAQENFPGYEAHMLAANTIQGLLGMRIRYTDGRASYYYDITSRQPLGRLLEGRQITVGEICGLIRQIYGTLKRMEEFFLGDKGILLEPQYIYIEPETFQAGLCFVPGLEGNFSESLSRLLQYLLRQVDHRDKRAVILAYSLYQESLKENYSLEDLLSLMEDEGRKEAAGNNREDQESGEEPGGAGQPGNEGAWSRRTGTAGTYRKEGKKSKGKRRGENALCFSVETGAGGLRACFAYSRYPLGISRKQRCAGIYKMDWSYPGSHASYNLGDCVEAAADRAFGCCRKEIHI